MTPTHRLSDRVAWLVGRASLQAQRLIQERFAAHELRKQHYGVLAGLADLGPTSQGPLADRLCLDRSDLVTILDDLEGLGYVVRVPDTTDRRRKIVQLTPSGATTLLSLDELVFAADDDLLAGLSQDERATLAGLLARILPPGDRGGRGARRHRISPACVGAGNGDPSPPAAENPGNGVLSPPAAENAGNGVLSPPAAENPGNVVL